MGGIGCCTYDGTTYQIHTFTYTHTHKIISDVKSKTLKKRKKKGYTGSDKKRIRATRIVPVVACNLDNEIDLTR